MAVDIIARGLALSDKTATSITITDTNNYFTSDNVEGALSELSEVGVKMNELEGYIG